MNFLELQLVIARLRSMVPRPYQRATSGPWAVLLSWLNMAEQPDFAGEHAAGRVRELAARLEEDPATPVDQHVRQIIEKHAAEVRRSRAR